MWVRSKHRNDRGGVVTSTRTNSAADKAPLSDERFQEAERLRSESATEAFHAMHFKGELSRRLMKFWDAY